MRLSSVVLVFLFVAIVNFFFGLESKITISLWPFHGLGGSFSSLFVFGPLAWALLSTGHLFCSDMIKNIVYGSCIPFTAQQRCCISDTPRVAVMAVPNGPCTAGPLAPWVEAVEADIDTIDIPQVINGEECRKWDEQTLDAHWQYGCRASSAFWASRRGRVLQRAVSAEGVDVGPVDRDNVRLWLDNDQWRRWVLPLVRDLMLRIVAKGAIEPLKGRWAYVASFARRRGVVSVRKLLECVLGWVQNEGYGTLCTLQRAVVWSLCAEILSEFDVTSQSGPCEALRERLTHVASAVDLAWNEARTDIGETSVSSSGRCGISSLDLIERVIFSAIAVRALRNGSVPSGCAKSELTNLVASEHLWAKVAPLWFELESGSMHVIDVSLDAKSIGGCCVLEKVDDAMCVLASLVRGNTPVGWTDAQWHCGVGAETVGEVMDTFGEVVASLSASQYFVLQTSGIVGLRSADLESHVAAVLRGAIAGWERVLSAGAAADAVALCRRRSVQHAVSLCCMNPESLLRILFDFPLSLPLVQDLHACEGGALLKAGMVKLLDRTLHAGTETQRVFHLLLVVCAMSASVDLLPVVGVRIIEFIASRAARHREVLSLLVEYIFAGERAMDACEDVPIRLGIAPPFMLLRTIELLVDVNMSLSMDSGVILLPCYADLNVDGRIRTSVAIRDVLGLEPLAYSGCTVSGVHYDELPEGNLPNEINRALCSVPARCEFSIALVRSLHAASVDCGTRLPMGDLVVSGDAVCDVAFALELQRCVGGIIPEGIGKRNGAVLQRVRRVVHKVRATSGFNDLFRDVMMMFDDVIDSLSVQGVVFECFKECANNCKLAMDIAPEPERTSDGALAKSEQDAGAIAGFGPGAPTAESRAADHGVYDWVVGHDVSDMKTRVVIRSGCGWPSGACKTFWADGEGPDNEDGDGDDSFMGDDEEDEGDADDVHGLKRLPIALREQWAFVASVYDAKSFPRRLSLDLFCGSCELDVGGERFSQVPVMCATMLFHLQDVKRGLSDIANVDGQNDGWVSDVDLAETTRVTVGVVTRALDYWVCRRVVERRIHTDDAKDDGWYRLCVPSQTT